jgi:hypothetical protein
VFAGSWINHNFKIWIGHDEDNAAWDLLSQTRETLVKYEAAHPDMSAAVRDKAWEQIYIAEGSDWCWWYGDDHRGDYNEQFDRIYRQHLIAVYELLGLDTPFELLKPIYAGQVSSFTVLPDSLLTPTLDGRETHFYQWAGAGSFDCLRAGGAMHQVDRRISAIYFAYDRDCVYIRLDFGSQKGLVLSDGLKAVLTFFQPARTVTISLDRQEDGDTGPVRFCL